MEIGTDVQIRQNAPNLPRSVFLQFGTVIGVTGARHCAFGSVYKLELSHGIFLDVCSCSFVRSPPRNTLMPWGSGVWKPKSLRGMT